MLNLQLDYFKFRADTDKVVQKLKKTRQYCWVELSDKGTARFTRRIAEEFAVQVKMDYLSGEFESRVPDLSAVYQHWKYTQVGGEPIGKLYGGMIGSIQAWRSRIAGRGWMVGIDQTKNVADLRKLRWLELGIPFRSKGGPQPPRPIFAMSLNRYVGSNFGRHVQTATDAIKNIWR